jgi:hypothetical protein
MKKTNNTTLETTQVQPMSQEVLQQVHSQREFHIASIKALTELLKVTDSTPLKEQTEKALSKLLEVYAY